MDFKLLDNFFDCVVIIDKNRKVLYANKSAKEVLKIKEGESCFGLFSICENCPMELVEEEGKGIQVYDVKSLRDGKHFCLSMTPYMEEGEFKGVVEVFRDVSRVIFYMEEVKRQKEFTEVILNSIFEAILVLSEDKKILLANKVASKLLCIDEKPEGKSLKEIFGADITHYLEAGKRTDIYINTPCGKQKASVLLSKLGKGEGYVLSLYIIPELLSFKEKEFEILTKSPKFLKVLDTARTIADSNVNVLIEGETGTGKTLLAKYIHFLSNRREKPFVYVNCAAIPETLLEAELFGYVKGAFTGAVRDKPGKVEIADGGTLFLDEIAELPLHLQVKLLHFIQDKEFERIGDIKTRRVNVRIIAATNKDLRRLVREGKFREDLYWRLNVVSIKIPPLRERKEDIPILVKSFIEKFSKLHQRPVKGISSEAMKILLSYDYPGNVRELENIIERAIVISSGNYILPQDLPEELQTPSDNIKDENDEIAKIKEALELANGNKTLAAKILGIHRTTLWRKLKEYGLS
ncbi:MAG: sigma-54-dependent Fis family transcriptional regulator [Aquifex sp.]|nr:MAG: sigma-54-dependent Fis family transcriptional regulator [Aquifex sp.]